MPKQKGYYKISKVIGHREVESGVEYKVHWAGYPSSQDTWEPESNLQDCQEYIQEYIMNKLKSPQPRRSARLANTSVVYSDEEQILEEEVKSPQAKVKKPRKTRPKKPKVQLDVVVAKLPDSTPSYSHRVLRSSVDRSPTVTSYSLRSSGIENYSSDDDADFSSVHHVKKVSTPTTKPIGRMALSEARFHADIDKLKHVSSTPFTEDTTTTRSKHRNQDRTLETTTTRITRKTSAPDPQDTVAGGSTVEEEEAEEVVTIVTKATPPAPQPDRAWLEVGWKEVALAGFLAGVGVLGYLCYVGDVCGYC